MEIRDSFAVINGDNKTITIPSNGLDIVADDGRTLFGISIKDNVLRIDAGNFCKIGDKIFDDKLIIKPIAVNCIELTKCEYIK